MVAVLNPLLAYAAGALTILSPCVLPLVPIVLASAAQRHRFAPLALTAGLVLAFTATGFVVAAFGRTLGLDPFVVRAAGALAMCLVAVVLLIPRLQNILTLVVAPLATWAGNRQALLDGKAGLWGQALVGALLGVVWAPCVGPTLGAAIALAAEGRNLGDAAVTMVSFGLGISTVLVLIASAARGQFARWRNWMTNAGGSGKAVLGTVLLLIGIFILTGVDRKIEAFVLDCLPEWASEWSTAI